MEEWIIIVDAVSLTGTNHAIRFDERQIMSYTKSLNGVDSHVICCGKLFEQLCLCSLLHIWLYGDDPSPVVLLACVVEQRVFVQTGYGGLRLGKPHRIHLVVEQPEKAQ